MIYKVVLQTTTDAEARHSIVECDGAAEAIALAAANEKDFNVKNVLVMPLKNHKIILKDRIVTNEEN